MIFYKLECLNEDGQIECNGYYLHRDNAEKAKKEHDENKRNIRYGVVQYIVEIETED